MLARIGCTILFVSLITRVCQAEPKTWEYVSAGQYQELKNPTTASTADPTLDRAEQLLLAGRAQASQEFAIAWFKSHKGNAQADRALYLIALAEDISGDPIRAFYYLDELLDEHPDSRLFAAAMQKQYDIGDAYLRGRKRKFLGMPILGAEDEAIEMLYRVQTRSPGSPIGEKALLRSADYYFADRQYDLAEDAYAAFIRQYPRSPSLPEARLRQAYSAYAQFHGPRFEVTPIIDARERLTAVMAQYPELAQQENIPAMLEQIDAAIARKLYITGDFYKRTHEPRAAAYAFRYLLRAFPNSAEAPQARQALAKLPSRALDMPEPKVQRDTTALRSEEPMPTPRVR